MLSACSERAQAHPDQRRSMQREIILKLHLRRLHCGTDSRSNCSPYFIPRADLVAHPTRGSGPAEWLRLRAASMTTTAQGGGYGRQRRAAAGNERTVHVSFRSSSRGPWATVNWDGNGSVAEWGEVSKPLRQWGRGTWKKKRGLSNLSNQPWNSRQRGEHRGTLCTVSWRACTVLVGRLAWVCFLDRSLPVEAASPLALGRHMHLGGCRGCVQSSLQSETAEQGPVTGRILVSTATPPPNQARSWPQPLRASKHAPNCGTIPVESTRCGRSSAIPWMVHWAKA